MMLSLPLNDGWGS